MLKSIFPTKVKDGLFVLTVVLVVMGGSLYVDAVKGVLRGEKIHVSVYLEGGTVEEMLTDGNMVTTFRRTVGKIESVGFFTAEIVRPSEASRAKLEDLAANPDQLGRLRALQKELAARPEIVQGVKLEVLLYKEMFGPMWPLFGDKSEAKIAAAGMLGEPFLQVYPGGGQGGMKDGEKLNFPKNDPAAGPGTPLFGKELVTYEEVGAAQQRLAAFKAKQAEFEKLLEEIATTNAKPEEKAPAGEKEEPESEAPHAPNPTELRAAPPAPGGVTVTVTQLFPPRPVTPAVGPIPPGLFPPAGSTPTWGSITPTAPPITSTSPTPTPYGPPVAPFPPFPLAPSAHPLTPTTRPLSVPPAGEVTPTANPITPPR